MDSLIGIAPHKEAENWSLIAVNEKSQVVYLLSHDQLVKYQINIEEDTVEGAALAASTLVTEFLKSDADVLDLAECVTGCA